MTNEELKKKIVAILNKNFTKEWVCTPIYTTNDGKEIELPQELCKIFNDIVVQAAIPYFADALIAAGYGDVKEIKYRVRRAEKALYIACRETAEIIFKDDFDRHAQEYMYGYLIQAEKELAEEGKDD